MTLGKEFHLVLIDTIKSQRIKNIKGLFYKLCTPSDNLRAVKKVDYTHMSTRHECQLWHEPCSSHDKMWRWRARKSPLLLPHEGLRSVWPCCSWARSRAFSCFSSSHCCRSNSRSTQRRSESFRDSARRALEVRSSWMKSQALARMPPLLCCWWRHRAHKGSEVIMNVANCQSTHKLPLNTNAAGLISIPS